MSLVINETWVNSGSEFYNRSMKSWLIIVLMTWKFILLKMKESLMLLKDLLGFCRTKFRNV